MTEATVVLLITGHPATGKTTLAHYLAQELRWPLVSKDQIKETLLDTLGWSTVEWSRRLSVATWALLYQQIDSLLRANITHIAESNFDPVYANAHWQRLVQQYDFRLIQLRCETEAETLLKRYRERIKSGARHPGHVDQVDDPAFHEAVSRGSLDWIDVPGQRLSVDTGKLAVSRYATVAASVRKLLHDKAPTQITCQLTVDH